MARVLEEIPQEIELEPSETEAMLRGSSAAPRRCSRSSVGFALLGVAVLAMLVALALPKEHRLRKSHESVIGLDDDSIWASVLSPDAMKQYQKQKEKSQAKASETVSKVQKSASDMASSLNDMLTKPAPAPAAPAPAAPAPPPVKAAEPVSKLQAKAQDTVNQLEANMEDPMKAVQNAADQVKSVLNIGLPAAPAPAVPNPPAVPAVKPIVLPPVPKIQPPPMPVLAPAAPATAESKADKIKKMAEEYMQEAAKAGNAKQKAQLESLAKMLKKDAAKVAGTAKASAASAVGTVAAAVVPPPVAPAPIAAPPVAAPVVQTVTDNPGDSPLAPQKTDQSGDPCVDDEEDFGGLCYKKCSILSGGSHPCRSSAWSCCAVPEGPSCASKASFGNCWVHMGFCGGYSVAGDAEVAQTGNSCPTGEGGCLTNEEMFGNECFKKCSLLDPQHPHRVGPDSCCSKPGGFDCFWPSNLKSSPSFNVGGGEGDKNSGTPGTAHAPMLQLSQ